MDFEYMLFDIAPWTKELMFAAKNYDGGKFLDGRSGWIERDVVNPETIYDHNCKLAYASYCLFQTDEAVAIAVSHELPEIIGPDYIFGTIDAAVKHDEEYRNMLKLRDTLPNGEFWFESWLKYENKEGVGRAISELNKICPAVQAVDYMRASNGHHLEEFYPTARRNIKIQHLVDLLDHICITDITGFESAYMPYFDGLKKLNLEFQEYK
jgi:5'-deoxynucleotidase YfbR-like HD superfamily hydrolase